MYVYIYVYIYIQGRSDILRMLSMVFNFGCVNVVKITTLYNNIKICSVEIKTNNDATSCISGEAFLLFLFCV